jgi:MOSC domain-containing protein YiiM
MTDEANIVDTPQVPQIAGIALRRQRKGPMLTVTSCAVSVEHGVARDTRGKPGKRQVTLLSLEAWEDACRGLDIDLAWTARRANILVRGKKFSAEDVGKTISIGELRLEITRETDPCIRMDAAHQGLQAALMPDWSGGVCCRVLVAGHIAVGDRIDIQ